MKRTIFTKIVSYLIVLTIFTSFSLEIVEANSSETENNAVETLNTYDCTSRNESNVSIQQTIRIVYKYTIRWKKHKKKKINKSKPVKLNHKKVTVKRGSDDWIRLLNANGNKVKWYNSNNNVIKIERDGSYCRILAKKPGHSTITAKYKGKTYKCKVTIKDYKKPFELWVYSHDNPKDIYDITSYHLKKSDNMIYTINKYSIGDYNFESSVTFKYSELEAADFYLAYEIEDENILSAYWSEWDDELIHLNFQPMAAGETWVTVTNSFCKQKFRFKVIVTEIDELIFETVTFS